MFIDYLKIKIELQIITISDEFQLWLKLFA